MIEDDYLRNGVARRLAELKDFKFAYLNWNREPFMSEYYHWCERCKAAFEKHSGKNAANMKTGNEVEKAYPQEFLKFRSSQHHAITKLYADMCKKANVTPVLCSYARSGSVSGDLRLEKMAGDQKTYYREFAMITPMIYQTPDKLWDPIKINQAYYPGIIPVYTSDENSNGNTPGYSIITPESVYLETMISAMLNCRGICLFVGYHTFNGQQINALRKALDEIAAMEEFFFSGDQAPADTVKVLSSSLTIRSKVYRKGTRLVLGVVNPDTEKEGVIEFQVNVPGKLFSLKDLKRNKYYNKNNRYALNSSDKCVIKLTPGEIAYLELAEPVRGTIRMPGIVMPEKPQGSKAKVLLTNKSWKCVQKDGVLDISAAGIAYQVYATDGGVLGGKNILAGGNGNGGFFRDLLLVPKAANWCPDSRSEYTVKSVKTLGNDLKIVLSRKYRLAAVAGLEIEKTYTFATNGSVRADIRLINNSSKPLKLAYWSHNRTALPEGKAFFTYGKNKVLDAARTNAQDFRTPAEKPYVINEKTAGSIECLTGTVDQYYFWLGSHGASMEFFGQPYTVEPGKEGKAAFIFTPAKVLPLKKKVKL